MSSLAELSRKLDALQATTTATATDVQWIKQGMEKGDERMDKHDQRIGKLENHRHRQLGFTAALSAAVGAMSSAIFGHVVKL